jgi:hypothetical protein
MKAIRQVDHLTARQQLRAYQLVGQTQRKNSKDNERKDLKEKFELIVEECFVRIQKGRVVGFRREGKGRVLTKDEVAVVGKGEVAVPSLHVIGVIGSDREDPRLVGDLGESVGGSAGEYHVAGEVHALDGEEGRVDGEGEDALVAAFSAPGRLESELDLDTGIDTGRG